MTGFTKLYLKIYKLTDVDFMSQIDLFKKISCWIEPRQIKNSLKGKYERTMNVIYKPLGIKNKLRLVEMLLKSI